MSNPELDEKQRDQAYEFVANIFGMTRDESAKAETPVPPGREFSAATPRKNQPEFWADAPWRLEPDQDHLPLLFIIRDGDIQPPGKGPWRLRELRVQQRLVSGTWHDVRHFLPADLPGIDAEGHVDCNFWTHRFQVPLSPPDPGTEPLLKELQQGGPPLHLQVVFEGSFPPYEEVESPAVHLEVFLAEHGLPQGRVSLPSGPRRWFYGDTHYHSDHTNDVKEFGGPVPDSRQAGLAIGLDWLVITDHSCDLDEAPANWDGTSPALRRWDELKAQVASPEISDDRFRCLLGEEITLRGGDGERYVHMLAFGALEEMIEGGFLPEGEGSFMTRLFQEAIEDIINLAIRHGGYHPDTGRRLFGPVHTLAEVFEALPPETLVFAAHPYTVAQPPFINGDWDVRDMDNLRLTGHEAWNGRSRRSALFTDDPFSRPNWTDPRKLARADEDRLKKILSYVEGDWTRALETGVDTWSLAESMPTRRPVFIAGSDAHGSFNYSVGWGWDYQTQFMCNDNALGRVRTAIFLPEHAAATVPETEEILAALKKGSCAVTDGPLLEFWLGHGGRKAYMGDVLTVDGEDDVEMRVVAHTTPEFGDVEKIEVVTYTGDPSGAAAGSGADAGLVGRIGAALGRLRPGWGRRKTTVRPGRAAGIRLAGQQGFCRVQVETMGPDGERFCCFTNPIWLRTTPGRARRLRITLAA